MKQEREQQLKKANIRLAIGLGAIAILLAMWPLYMLRQGITG